MGIFDRFRSKQPLFKNGIDLNKVEKDVLVKQFNFKNKITQSNYGDLFLFTILNKINNCLKNVTFKTSSYNLKGEYICNFIELNISSLVYQYYSLGFICIIQEDNELRLPQLSEIKIDSYGRVTNKNAVTYYSDIYNVKRCSHFKLIEPYIKTINTALNNTEYVINTLGLFGVLSGKTMPISEAQKEQLNNNLKKNYGLEEDKYNFIISNAQVDFTPITIPFDKLETNEIALFNFKCMCRFFSINPDLFIGESTYNNQENAIKELYNNCIKPLAEILLLIGRSLFINMSIDLVSSKIITYTITNVPEINNSLSSLLDDRIKFVNYLKELDGLQIDVSTELKKLENELKTLLTEI